ncbi:MAG TPA: winged helix-turn-helix domain-containing protein [Acidimicrobiia bacterium]
MRFTNRELAGIPSGDISVVLRRWKSPRVKTGSKVRTAIGLVEIRCITEVADGSDLPAEDVARGGFADREEMVAWANGVPGRLFRIEVGPAGPDPRVALRNDADLDEVSVAEISRRLERMDRATDTPWTRRTLRLIADRPGVVSTELAAEMGLERPYFKQRVRRLKELGLTESLEVGYRLSPRGQAYLDAIEPRKTTT